MLPGLGKAYVRLSLLSFSLPFTTCRHSDSILNACRQLYKSRACLNSNPYLFRHWSLLNSLNTPASRRLDSAAKMEWEESEKQFKHDDSGIVVDSSETSADATLATPMETASLCEAYPETDEKAVKLGAQQIDTSLQTKETKSRILPENLLNSVTSLVKDGKVEVPELTEEEQSQEKCSAQSNPKKKRKRNKQKNRKLGSESVDTKSSASPQDDMAGVADEDVKSETGKVSRPSSAKQPNHFVSIQINNPEIHRSMETVQEAILEAEKNLDTAMVSVATAHLTLLVIHLETEEDIARAGASLERCVSNEWASYTDGTDGLELEVAGLGHFDHTVLFAKVTPGSQLDVVKNMAASVEKCLSEDGIGKADPKPFKPHITLMKFTRRRASLLKKKGIKRIEAELYKDYLDQRFGSDRVRSLQLCSMVKPKDPTTGYYHIEHQVNFGQPAITSKETS